MLHFRNKFFAIATAFFASSLFQPSSAFAERVDEEVFEDDLVEEEAPVKKIEPKVVLENLKESLEIGGNVKSTFSFTGIPSSCIKNNANDFRPFALRMLGENGAPLLPSFDAGLKGALSLGKTFKNDAGKNILKVNVTLEVDKYNDELGKASERLIELGSAKGIFMDFLKVGFDKEFVTGAKGMLIGGMWKASDMFTLNLNLMRDLDSIDIKEAKLFRKGDKDNKKNGFVQSKLPVLGVQGQFNLGDLGFVKLGGLVRVLKLDGFFFDNDNENPCSSEYEVGFGVGASSELHFIKNVDKLGINVLFGRAIGEYNPKMKACAENSKRVVGGIAKFGVPASIVNANEPKVEGVISFLNMGLDYAFKFSPKYEVSVGLGDLMIFGLEKGIRFSNGVSNVLNGNLGYKFVACKKLDISTIANFVKIFTEKELELNDNQKKLFQDWGWNLVLAADFKF